MRDGALETAYDAEMANLFRMLCTAFASAETEEQTKEAELRFHKGVLIADKAYQTAKNSRSAA